MPTTRSQQSEAEYESTGSTPEMDNSTVKSAMETAEIRLRNNLKMFKRLGEQMKDIIESKNERKWQRHQSSLEYTKCPNEMRAVNKLLRPFFIIFRYF